MSDPTTLRDLLPPEQWHAYVDAWCNGWSAGVDEGRRRADEDAARAHRAAAGVVLAMIRVPERDHEADARRAAKSAAYWAERRGEGGAA